MSELFQRQMLESWFIIWILSHVQGADVFRKAACGGNISALIFSTRALSDSSQSKLDLTKDLKAELQRCLAQLKSKREKISRLQEDLRTSHGRLEQLQTQLQGAEMKAKDSVVRTLS